MVWLVVAVGLGALLAVARASAGPLDDPDPAHQRPGILDLGALPVPAPPVSDGIPTRGREAVVFFVRPAGLPALCGALADPDLAGEPDLIVVVAGPVAPCAADVAVVADPPGRVAEAYGLRPPADGGAPVGYVVVDDAGRIRYRTLDPEVADLLGEVDTILRAA
ncbi:MAG TPA: hypothetical protein VGR26_02575 [Acidimicrobiales bacterium]|nr:hypothetical protein [Acidimicrobiales bacterium]